MRCIRNMAAWGWVICIWTVLVAAVPAVSWAQSVPITLSGKQTSGVGRVALRVSPDALVQVLPRAHADRRVVAIYRNDLDLSSQLDLASARHITEMSATSVGSGTWFLTLYLDDGLYDVQVEQRDRQAVLTVSARAAERALRRQAAPSLAAVLAGTATAEPEPPSDQLIEMLAGDARTVSGDLRDLRFDRPKWDDASVAPGVPASLRPLKDNPSERVGQLRGALSTPGVRGTARDAIRYLLAEAHLELGLPREAVGYLRQVEASPGAWPGDTVLLALGAAELQVGRWDNAHEACVAAALNGAAPGPALTCLAIARRGTGPLGGTPLARALLAHDTGSDERVIAAELLLADRRYDEALTVLEALGADPPKDLVAWRIALGDARFLTGKHALAEEVWKAIPASEPRLPIVDERRRLANMLKRPVHEWTAEIGDLDRTVADGHRAENPWLRAAAAEAHHTLSQIYLRFGEHDAAVGHLDLMLDRYPMQGETRAVQRRLLQACRVGLQRLADDEVKIPYLAYFETCWRPELGSLIEEPSLLLDAAARFEAAGFSARALDLTREAANWGSRVGQTPASVRLALAVRYVDAGMLDDARETLAYARTVEKASAAEVAVVQMQLSYAEGSLDKGLAVADLASRAPGKREAVTGWRGLLEARRGRCDRAIPLLARRLGARSQLGHPEPLDLQLSHARCLVLLDRHDEALGALTAFAKPLYEEGGAEAVPNAARWLASAAAHGAGVAAPDFLQSEEEVWQAVRAADGTWEAMVERNGRR